jgi:signal transduction histidine kinase/membrane-bound lytic murein transglycosylase MltF
MHFQYSTRSFAGRILSLFLASVFLLFLMFSPVYAEDGKHPGTVLRVGYIRDPGLLELDSDGNCQGYLAEYLTNIAQRIGCRLEYVPCSSLAELLGDLDDGKIDLLPDGAKTAEREHNYLFTQREIGSLNDALIVKKDDERYHYSDINSIAGMRVAVLEDYAPTRLLKDWLKENGISCRIIEYADYDQALDAVRRGDADATIYGDGLVEDFKTVVNFATIPYYVMLKKGNTELKKNIDTAMNVINAENSLYEVELYNKYFRNIRNGSQDFSEDELSFIAGHKNLKIAVLNDDAPYFSVTDGRQHGILVDYAEKLGEITGASFSFQVYNSQEEAIAAVKDGSSDLLGLYTAGILAAYKDGLRLTIPYNTISAMMITRHGTDPADIKTVAVKDRYLPLIKEKHILNENAVPLSLGNSKSCFRALQKHQTDAIICGMPSATWLINQTNSSAYLLTPVSALTFDLCGAVRPDEGMLCAVLNKANARLAGSTDGIIASNTVQENTWRTFISRIPPTVIISVTAVLVALIVCLIWALFMLSRRQQEKAAIERQKAENEKKETELAALERITEERNQFFSNISHDMRTPLNAIIGFAGLCREETELSRVRDYTEKIRSSGELLLNLVNDTLTVSKMASNKLELHPEAVTMEEIYKPLLPPIQIAAEKKKIDFRIDTEKLSRRTILADVLNVRKILLNLLTNAVKYTPEGGKVYLKIEDAGMQTVRITVCDNGIGMSEDYMSRHLFQPFSQETRAGYGGTGTGLGLSIVKQLVDLMGGTIEAESRKNEGTSFIVCLRFDDAGKEQQENKACIIHENSYRRSRALMLLMFLTFSHSPKK